MSMRSLLAVGSLLAAAGCASESPPTGEVAAVKPPPSAGPDDAGPPSQPPTPTTSCGTGSAEPASAEVLVYFGCDTDNSYPVRLYAFSRRVESSAGTRERLREAMRAYFAGPKRGESEQLFGFGSPSWLNGVDVRGERAIVDVHLHDGYGSTSAQSQFVWETLRALVFQFPEIDLLEPRHNGSCEAFGAIVQAGRCLLARRDGSFDDG